MNRSLQQNIRTIYVMGFFHSFLIVVPVFVPLLQGYGLSMSQVLQTQAIFALTIALFEVPSGYLADLWGRRNCVLLGAAINSVGFFSLLWADTFAEFIVYEMLLGVGFSLLSGADLAMLYDTELHLANRGEPTAGPSKSLSRLIAIEAAASGAAGVVASLLLLWSMDWIIWVQAVTGFAPLLLGLTLVEPPRQRSTAGHSDNARRIVELLLFGKPVVLWTALAIIVFGLLALHVFWSYQKFWELQGIPLEGFGYIWALFALTVSLSARYAGALEQRIGAQRLLLLIAVLPMLGLAGMILLGGWMGALIALLIQVSRGLSMTVFYNALNRRVPGDFRATVNSVVSLAIRGIFIVTGPLLGWALDRYGMGSTLVGLLVIFAPLIVLVLIPLTIRIRRERAAGESLVGSI
ncbi:MAG: MFS transporter [Pseudomonadota bacterium]